MDDETLPFFRVLAGSRPTENYLSRTFQASFTESAAFAGCILKLLWKACRIPGPIPTGEGWLCDYQPATPYNGSIRPDLCLRPTLPPASDSGHRPIFIESKVTAKLGEAQLKSYVASGTDVLVAVTKNWPEVPRRRLTHIGVNHLRWQDVARALVYSSPRSAKDKFICEAFTEYLEYSGMAYREDLTSSQLEDIRILLAKIGDPKHRGFVPGDTFELANSCLGLLQDVRRLAQETRPVLTKLRNWGPGHYHDQFDNGHWHAIGFEMYPKGKYYKSSLSCALYFSASRKDKIQWLVKHYGSQANNGQELWRPVSEFLSKRKLDADRLAQSIIHAGTRWKLF